MSKMRSKGAHRIRGKAASLIVGAAAIALVAPLVGCSSNGTGNEDKTPSGNASGTITVWTFLNPSTGQDPREVAFAKLIKDFETQNKKIHVVVEPKAYQDLATLYLSAFALGNEPDVIMVNTSSVGTLAQAGSLADLNKITTENFRKNVEPDLAQGYMKAQSIGGVQYTIPQWPNTGNVIMYRSDLAGDKMPSDADDFISKVAGLTDGKVYGFGLRGVSTTGSIFFDMSAGHGKKAWSEAFDKKGQFDFLSKEAKQTAEWIRKLGKSGALAPDATTATDNDIQDQFAAGRFAVTAAYGPRFTTWPNIAAGYDPATLRFTSYPTFNGNAAAPLESGWTWGISATTKHQAAAVKFVESLYSVKSSMVWAETGGQIPDRLSVLKDPYFANTKAGNVIQDFAKLAFAPGAVAFPANLANPSEVFKVANELVRKLIQTTTPVNTLLEEAKSSAYGS